MLSSLEEHYFFEDRYPQGTPEYWILWCSNFTAKVIQEWIRDFGKEKAEEMVRRHVNLTGDTVLIDLFESSFSPVVNQKGDGQK